MASAGIHVLLDLYELPGDTDCKALAVLTRAASIAQLTILGTLQHKFKPQGISILLLLAESHLSIHTWPEKRYASVDIYSCDGDHPVEDAVEYILRELKPGRYSINISPRGRELEG